MRFVADGAILHHRRVLIDKGPLLVRMAIQAQVIFPFLGFKASRKAAVGLMAVAASHLALPDGVMRGIERPGTNPLMAIIAKLGLLLGQKLCFRGMGLVTVAAGDIIQRMAAAPPVHERTGGMTLQTHGRGLTFRDFREPDDLAWISGFRMKASRPVAGFASPVFSDYLKISDPAMNGLGKMPFHLIVAAETSAVSRIGRIRNDRHGCRSPLNIRQGTAEQEQNQKQSDTNWK